jgi:hypothetical protein
VGLLLALACSAGAVPTEPLATNAAAVAPEGENAAGIESAAESDGTLPDSIPTEAAAPEVPPESADAESDPVALAIGSNVGERIPDFAITLVDGSTVTSAELLAQRQPTFLFFFETW